MATRVILHSDLNNFYASVECLRRPEIRDKPVVVTGAKEERHGVVLAKNAAAKAAGVKTGDVYWEARQKCGSSLVEIPADFSEYLRYSKKVRRIYEDYTDRIEAFGIDECWLDVTASRRLFGSGVQIAETIRRRVKEELGLTVSVGVSYNKIFAKLGSDMKKPDAVTEITPENYRETVWKLPAADLLYVGAATKKQLQRLGIKTIGDLANADEALLKNKLGKRGAVLRAFANGADDSPVLNVAEERNIRSVGNSLTACRDFETPEDVKAVLALLSDAVCSRLREAGARGGGVFISARSSALVVYRKQGKLPRETSHAPDVAKKSFELFAAVYPWQESVRSVGVGVYDLKFGETQTDFFGLIDGETCGAAEKKKRLDAAVDKLREKYGNAVIRQAIVLKDKRLSGADIKAEHTVHPVSFFKNGV